MRDFLKVIVYAGVFAVPFIVLIVANDLFFPFITGKNFVFRIVVEIIFAAWVLLALLEPMYRPRWSWIAGGFGIFLVVMFFANALGAHPATSFWSNYERMEGYVTLVHLFMYFLVLGSFLRVTQQWTWFWHASLTAATVVALNGLAEYADPEITGRVAGMLGNASYLAIYMLFHIFLLFYLFVRNPNVYMRLAYVALFALFAFVLLQTGTRGTAIGLVTGMGAMVAYVALFARSHPQFRAYAIGAVGLFVVLISSFFAFRDHAVVQESRTLSRIANIDLQEDLEVRGTIWSMAWSGFEERPLLGWGQGNFNYVFNQEYDPFLYDQEQWFDRVHNIFLDWLVAGGILGFVAYFSIFAATVYYLVRRQSTVPEAQRFTVLEQGALLGLLVAYLTHNLVVFDNIVSYIFFASVLAMVHARIGVPIPSVQEFKMAATTVRDVAIPATAVILVSVIYFTNIPGLQAAGDIISAMRAPSVEGRIEHFERAVNRGSFARQEIAEQYAQQAMQLAGNSQVPQQDREEFLARAEEALLDVMNTNPEDARIRMFLGSFYRGTNNPVQAREQFATARELSPRKPSVAIQQGATELAVGDPDRAVGFFQEAYELDRRNEEALALYVATLLQIGSEDEARDVLANADEIDDPMRAFALNEYALNVASEEADNEFLAELYEIRVEENPDTPQEWASLSFVYYEMEEVEQAVATLRRAAEAVPDFADTAECFAGNIEQGLEPEEGC